MKHRVANLQYTAAATEAESLAVILPMIAEARAEGAALIALPECASRITADRKVLMAEAETEAQSRSLASLSEEAARQGCWMLIGSLILRHDDDPSRLTNRSFLIRPDGSIHARYDKIHMFDARINDGQQYRESQHYTAGSKAVLAVTPLGRIGMTICYDLRFPGLYRMLAQAGAAILTVPSAFTRVTGAAHWHALMRARAIENGCYIVAPAQTGRHDGGRETWGHSLIIDPWGEVLADAGTPPGITIAEIDPGKVEKARRAVPSLEADQMFSLEKVGSTEG
ncbi:MAG: carbon-nitrogen hydrolase family protein [Candidatus Puniceispirillales bacterium]